LTIFTGCAKDTVKNNTWAVEKIRVHSDSAMMHPTEYISLSFIENGKYYIFQSETHSTTARVKMGSSTIKFEYAGMFPEHPFARDCVMLLTYHITHYHIDSGNLILTGDNGANIRLRKVKML
jgi:hypothetical protein